MSMLADLMVGEALRTIRLIRGVTQHALSKKTGLTINFLSQVENNKKGVSQAVIERIGKALNVPASFFYLLAERSDDPLVKGLQDSVRKSLEKGDNSAAAGVRLQSSFHEPVLN